MPVNRKQKVVLDTSIIGKWLFDREDFVAQADELLSRTLAGEFQLYAPEISRYELGNIIFKRKLSKDHAKSIVATIYSLPIFFVKETQDRFLRSAQLSTELGVTFYDAAFISLAEELSAPLISQNLKHQGKAKMIEVTSLPNFL